MAEADPEEGHLAFAHRLHDGRLLRDEPRVHVLVPDVHRAAHDHHRVVTVEGGDLVAFIELHRVPVHPVLGHEVAEDAGMLGFDVLKDQETHDRCLACWAGLAGGTALRRAEGEGQ